MDLNSVNITATQVAKNYFSALCSIPNCTSGVNTVFNPATPPSEPVPSN